MNGKLKNFQQAIARTCNGEKPTAYGFIWRYADANEKIPPKHTPVQEAMDFGDSELTPPQAI